LLASVRDDPDFGPVLTVGAGGSLVELLNDVAHVVIPCGEPDLREALLRTRFGALLSGVRGRPPGDVDALVGALASLSRTYLALADPPRELEVNPLVVLASGEGVLALDVLTT
jgi:acetyl-CoA synthetase